MESSHNRFIDGEDDGINAYDIKQLRDNCEKWSLASDLGLLSHLKQFSNDLLNKTENTNQSINSLVYETKIHCVKVNNVMNDFQMLANSQFVENRVYDEEIDDIINGGSNGIQNDETVVNKPKDEDILPKIKSAINIGLNFLSQRFDNISHETSQTDSDDENDQILEGLLSNTAKDEYSQRLLPYIIGSEEFIKDNYVGLSCVEENPTIDLKTKVKNDVNLNNISVESNYENTFPVHNNVSLNENIFNNDLNDSEEESGDIFGGVSHKVNAAENNDKQKFSDDSDSDQFSVKDHNNDDSSLLTNNKVESKPILSFHDQLSAAIKGNKISRIADESENKPIEKIKSNKSEIPIDIHSDSSDDESESIFRISKSKSKETKVKSNISNLFGDESNNTSLFDDKNEKKITGNQILPNLSTRKVSVTASALFDDEDDEEEDDLFSGVIAKKVTQPTKTIINTLEKKTENKPKVLPARDVPPLRKQTLFDDEEEEEDDLFSGISIKTNKTGVQNADAFKPITKSNTKPSNIKVKPNYNLIGELSSALKKKNIYTSDDENSVDGYGDKVDNNIKTNPNLMTESLFDEINNKNDTNSQILTEKKSVQTIPIKEEIENKSDRNNSITSDLKSEEIMISKENYSNDSNAQNEDDFYSVKSTNMLSNDSLKQRAILGSKRNRRPPSKKVVKLTPITDFSQNSEQNSDISLAPEEKSPPIASIRNIKSQNNSISDSIISSHNIQKPYSVKQDQKSIASLLTSPSTEEEDIFPSHTNSFTNQSISKTINKSDYRSSGLFNDNEDTEDSLFTNSVKNNDRNDIKRQSIDRSGLFDTSDSDDEQLVSNNSNKLDSNRISSIIKSSEKDLFNVSSSTDSSLSNKSDLKIESSKPAISLFSDSDDEDLFSAVGKTKSLNKTDKKYQKEEKEVIKDVNSVKVNKRPTNLNSLFSDSEDDKSDLFKKTDEIKPIKTKTIKPLFDVEDDDEDDIFAPKSSKVKTSNAVNTSQKKPKKESESSDLFDDPLFASHS